MRKSFFDGNNVLNFQDKGLRFAFGIEGFLDKEFKDDARYVKWIVRLYGSKNREKYEKIIPYHVCTSKDFEEFAPPAPEAEALLETYLTNPKRNLYCLDWDKLGEDLEIQGVYTDEVIY